MTAAGSRDHDITTDDYFTLAWIREIAVSPDGQFVAYTVSVPRVPMEDDNGPNWAELHVYDRDSGRRTSLR